jgi:hypothetical protein
MRQVKMKKKHKKSIWTGRTTWSVPANCCMAQKKRMNDYGSNSNEDREVGSDEKADDGNDVSVAENEDVRMEAAAAPAARIPAA